MEKLWRFIRQRDNALSVSTIVVGIIFGILSIFTGIDPKITIGIVLLVFSSSILLFLWNSKSVHEMKEHCTFKQSIGNILYRFDALEDEIRMNIDAAEEIWILSRTGRGWMKRDRFRRELDKVFKNRCRLLVLDPDNGALKMVQQSARQEWEGEDGLWYNKEVSSKFLNWFREGYPQTDVRVIDYLPAFTLLIINPSDRDHRKSLIYVELSSFKSGSRDRLIFKLSRTDSVYFNMFINEFEAMWKESRQWIKTDGNTKRKS